MTFPRWAIWIMNIAVLAILWVVFRLANLADWPACLGFVVGYFTFYLGFRWHYGWWPDFNMDGEDEKNSRLPRIDPSRTDWR